MAFLTMAVKVIWMTILFLIGCIVMMTLIVAGFSYAVKIAEDIRREDDRE